MDKILLLLVLLFTIKTSKSQGVKDVEVTEVEACKIASIEQKTDTLIAVIQEVNVLEEKKRKLKKELILLDNKIKEKKIMKSIKKYNEIGH